MSAITRFKIAKVSRQQPERILIYGTEGTGKTTFALNAPNALTIDVDDSARRMVGVQRVGDQLDPNNLPPQNFTELVEVINALKDPSFRGDRQTLVIDTADKIEQAFIHPEVVARWPNETGKQQPKLIDEIPFAKGFLVAMRVWSELLAALDDLQAKTNMNIIIVAHARVSKVDNLGGEDFSTYEPDLYAGKNTSAAALLREWADCVLFTCNEDRTRGQNKTDEKAGRAKRGMTTGRLLMYTRHQGWALAKNRTCLPEVMDVSWPAYAEKVAEYYKAQGQVTETSPKELLSMIESACKEIESWDDTTKDWRAEKFQPHLDEAGEDIASLRTLLSMLNMRIQKRREAQKAQ